MIKPINQTFIIIIGISNSELIINVSSRTLEPLQRRGETSPPASMGSESNLVPFYKKNINKTYRVLSLLDREIP